MGKPKEKEKEKTKEIEETYIPPEKRKQIIEHKCYFLCIKMEFQKIVNFLDTTSDDKDLPRFVTKNGLKFIINQKKIATLIKKSELKHQC